jgi:glycosyltransferase involved in cell wall biosynthesis
MRICVISPYYPPHKVPDGLGDYTRRLCQEIVRLGHEVIILVSDGYKTGGHLNQHSIKVIPFTSRWGLIALFKLISLCFRERFDIINLQYSPPLYSTFFKLLFPLTGILRPTVVTLHTLIGGEQVNKLAAASFILFCTEIISTNEEISYMIRKHWPGGKNPIQIPIGTNVLPIKQNPGIPKKPDNRLRLTHFGLFYPGKGVETILMAASMLKKEYDHFQLIMLGGEWPGAESYYRSLKKQAHQLGLDQYTHWMGYLPAEEISAQLSQTDILLIPYDQGISIRRSSYMAGLAHGLPIISTYSKITSAYVKDGENIVLVPPKNPTALKEKIMELIQNPRLRKQLGEQAGHLREEFQWPNIAAKTIEVFEQIRC